MSVGDIYDDKWNERDNFVLNFINYTYWWERSLSKGYTDQWTDIGDIAPGTGFNVSISQYIYSVDDHSIFSGSFVLNLFI